MAAAVRDAGGAARRSSRSGARSGTAREDSARTAGRSAPRGSLSGHGLDSPPRAPAPPWGSAATGEASAGAPPPSRSCPLRAAAGPETPPAAAARRRALLASATTSGWPPGAAPLASAAHRAHNGPGPRSTPGTRRPSPDIPRTSRTDRPRRCRSSTERLDARTRTPHAAHRRMRVVAPLPRRLGCTSTRAFTFSDLLALRRHRRGGHRRGGRIKPRGLRQIHAPCGWR